MKKVNQNFLETKNLCEAQLSFKNNFVIVDNSKHLSDEEAEAKFVTLVTKIIRKFVSKHIKKKLGKTLKKYVRVVEISEF